MADRPACHRCVPCPPYPADMARDCTCRSACGNQWCPRLNGVPAAEVAPGMVVRHSDTADPVMVASVTAPDADGMVWVTPAGGPPWRVSGDWWLQFYTAADRDLEEALIMDGLEGDR